MNTKLLTSVLTAGALALGTLAVGSAPNLAQSSPKYYCGTSSDGVPTTFARKATGEQIALIRWQRNWGGNLTPQQRCEEVSSNFQKASEKGALKFLATREKKGYQIVCAMPQADFPTGDCANYLFTVRRGEDAKTLVRSLEAVGAKAFGAITQAPGGWKLYELNGVFLEE